MTIEIRGYSSEDAEALAAIYYNTIHNICIRDYSPAQIDVWAPKSSLEVSGWKKKWSRLPPLVAVFEGQVVGFAELEPNGHIDCFYCHHEWIGRGVGSALMKSIEEKAKENNLPRLFVEVSITAKPFFERKGFFVITPQTIVRNGIELKNFKMEKDMGVDNKMAISEQNATKSEKAMHRELVTIPQIKLVGITVRTTNKQEADKTKGKIFPCVLRYFHEGLAEKIPNRKRPGVTFCAYTDYESDHTGAYTYLIGEEVSSLNDPLPEGFHEVTIPKQTYAKFTTQPAPMPDVIVNAWNAVWAMSEKQLGGKRTYQTDFEIYDERAADHQNIVLDLCIGIKNL